MKAILYELLIHFYVAIDMFHIQYIPYQYYYVVTLIKAILYALLIHFYVATVMSHMQCIPYGVASVSRID